MLDSTKVTDNDMYKRAAAEAALAYVEDGMKVGLGTGSTTDFFVELLAERVRNGLNVIAVSTSDKTRDAAARLGIPPRQLDEEPSLDLTVDGADEVDPALRLIKGGGGALLKEKIVATSSRRMIVIADESKLVRQLGAYPLPLEIIPFGATATRLKIEEAVADLGLKATFSMRLRADGVPFVTDCRHFILDLACGLIPDAEILASVLDGIAGVVEHGLFNGIADLAIIAGPQGPRTIARKPPDRPSGAARQTIAD